MPAPRSDHILSRDSPPHARSLSPCGRPPVAPPFIPQPPLPNHQSFCCRPERAKSAGSETKRALYGRLQEVASIAGEHRGRRRVQAAETANMEALSYRPLTIHAHLQEQAAMMESTHRQSAKSSISCLLPDYCCFPRTLKRTIIYTTQTRTIEMAGSFAQTCSASVVL